MIGYRPPAHYAPSFTCPYCGVLTSHRWTDLWSRTLQTSQCHQCNEPTVWFRGVMIVPLTGGAPLPHPDLPEDVKADYLEARSIAGLSPRGAAALLRLTIDKLTTNLGAEGRDINDRIRDLVRKGLDPRIQQALDVVRVVGNESVHPGTIDLRDDPELAGALFMLVNAIADEMITRRKHIEAVYAKLPQDKRDAIAKRDAKAVAANGTAPTTS